MRAFSIGLIATIAVATPVLAKEKNESVAPPPVYQAVVDCRTISDGTERLACFDRTVGVMASATAEKDLVVIDRATMRETRRGLFGFNLPKLKLFGGGSDDERDEVKQLDSTITGIRSAKDGLPVFTIEDGARWKQTDGRNVFPKVGHKITIKAAALGSYMASINSRSGVRVMRLPE